MSFQAYLDAIEAKTGRTPRQLLDEAIARGYQQPGVKAGVIVQWLAEVCVKRPVFGPLEKGDIVRHATWGEGEVVRVVGDSIYTFFPVHGEKLLKAHFLEKISA